MPWRKPKVKGGWGGPYTRLGVNKHTIGIRDFEKQDRGAAQMKIQECYVCVALLFLCPESKMDQNETFLKAEDISLSMCKAFADTVLFATRFHYIFFDGTELDVEFRPWAFFHLLSMQHIGVYELNKTNIHDKIRNGFDFEDIKKNKATKKKYSNEKDRIVAFVYLYRALRNCEVVYFERQQISETSKVRVDYIFFHEFGEKGINVGTRQVGEVQVPLSILISKKSNVERYIENGKKKNVQRIEISDIATKEMIEVVEIQKEKEY